jgi:hypothetical protein
MRQQVGQRDRLRIGGRDMKRFEVGIEISMQVQFALLDQLQHSGRGEELSHRANPEDGRLGADGSARLPISLPIALGQEEPPILHDGHNRPRDMIISQLHAEHTIQKALHLARIAEPGGRRRG